MEVGKLADRGGVEVRGLDLAAPPTPGENEALNALFEEHGLVVFRDQQLTKQQLVDAGIRFGGSVLRKPLVADDPEALGISVLSNRGYDGTVIPNDPNEKVGEAPWHTDQGYLPNPNRGKILYCVQAPEEGGMTGFVDGYAAYDALSAEMKSRIEELHVVQSWGKLQRRTDGQDFRLDGKREMEKARFADVLFPIVYPHPVSGRKVLNFPPMWAAGIAEMAGPEGEALTQALIEHITQPKLQYWHRYALGDAVLWDNWRFLHKAGGTPGRYARTIWSITLNSGPQIGRVAGNGQSEAI